MSHSPTAQFGQGTGSGRRTRPTTRSPFFNPLLGPGSTTRPSDSWPRTRRVSPGGAQPYLPVAISTSVPHTPTAMASTSTEPYRGSGSETFSNCAEPAFFGSTVIAFITFSLSLGRSAADLLLCCSYNLVRLKPKFLLQFFERRRRPEGMHSDHSTSQPDVAFPPECRGLFDCDPRRHIWRQDAVSVFLRLMLEDIPGWH